MRRLFIPFALLCLLPAAALNAQIPNEAELAVKGPTPEWVVPVDPPAASEDQAYENGGTQYLLVDSQSHPASHTDFGHRAFRFLSVAGVEDSSTLTWSIDPDYQRLTLHQLVIHRDGETIDLLEDAVFRLNSAYQDDAARSYDNTVEARIILEDARVGDVLEYSYSVTGRNPTVTGRYSSSFDLNWTVPVERVARRIVWQGDRPLKWRAYNNAGDPAVVKRDGFTEYVWTREKTKPTHWEDNMPPYAYAQEWVMVSDWESWEEVSKWGADLYPLDAPLPPGLQELAGELSQLESQEARVVAAIRHLQDEYRYVSIVFGPHSYQPFDPAIIDRRRYGDCKDKSLLLCLLLRELGVEADPVLVDINDRETIVDRPPTPLAFDHVVTRFELDGETYWVDPTITLQGGGLGEFYFPAYGAGLPLRDPGVEPVTGIEAQAQDQSATHLVETFTVEDWAGGGELDVHTTYRGSAADSIRRMLASTSLRDLQRDYVEYYTDYYGALEPTAPLAYEDDREANVLTVTEAYAIEDLFVPDEDEPEGMEVRYFESDYVYENLPAAPVGADRQHPFWIYHDNKRQTIRIHLPDDSDFDREEVIIENPWMKYEYRVTQDERLLEIDTHYRAPQGPVPVSEYDRFASDNERAENLTSYGIIADVTDETDIEVPEMELDFETAEASDGYAPNWLLIGFTLVLLPLAIAPAVWLYLKRRPEPFDPPVPDAPAGISGWLILPAIGVVLRPFMLAFGLIELAPLYDANQWRLTTDPNSDQYIAGIEPLLLFEVAFNLFVVIASLLLLISFFQKKWFVRRLYQGVLIFVAAGLTFDNLFYLEIADGTNLGADETILYTEIFRTWLVSAIWIAYFQQSKRVRNTFRK